MVFTFTEGLRTTLFLALLLSPTTARLSGSLTILLLRSSGFRLELPSCARKT
jgi:hypothetical protein